MDKWLWACDPSAIWPITVLLGTSLFARCGGTCWISVGADREGEDNEAACYAAMITAAHI